VILAAALCPHPPLLLREVTGGEDPVPELRAACRSALESVLATRPDVVHLVGADGAPVTAASYAPGWAAGAAAGDSGAAPLSLLVGRRLLAEAGWDGAVRELPVPVAASPAECVRLGTGLGGGLGGRDERAALVVLGDGSARRGPKAPGYVDERALPFDAEVLQALRAADAVRLTDLDSDLAAQLLAAGRPAWQVLAGVLPGLRATSAGAPDVEVLYADDPFGVQYVVATFGVAAVTGPGVTG